MTSNLLTSIALIAMTLPSHGSETSLTGAQITAALAGHTYRSADANKKIEQIFQSSGATYYSQNGNQSQGRWEVRGDQYCSQWPPSEAWSCYAVVVDGEVLNFVSQSGTRFPVVKVN